MIIARIIATIVLMIAAMIELGNGGSGHQATTVNIGQIA
jgi:hypothetical protein